MSSDSGSDTRAQTRSSGFFLTPGHGHLTTWLCMGCHSSRSNLGAKGKGIRRRCAACIATKTADNPIKDSK